MPSYSEGLLFGVALVALSVVFLLSGLGLFKEIDGSQFIVSENSDIIIAFIALGVGIAYVYSTIKESK